MNEGKNMGEDDPLRFLDRNIKRLLESPQNIVFISRTAFLNISKPHKSIRRNHAQTATP